jgi:predicted RNase H-like HicB family nuclease
MTKKSSPPTKTWIAHLALVDPDNPKINTFLSCVAQGSCLETALTELKATIRSLYVEAKENQAALPSGAKVYLHQTVEIGAMHTNASCIFMSGTMDVKAIGLDIPGYVDEIVPLFATPEPLIPDGLRRDFPYTVRDSDGRAIRLEPFLILPDLR